MWLRQFVREFVNSNKMTEHKAKRIRKGHYIYRGYHIYCIGYHAPDQKVVWEAVDEDNCGFAHSYSLRDTKILIDNSLDN